MNWRQLLARWHPTAPPLTPAQQARLAAWQRLPAASDTALAASRLVVVDVEASGLDVKRDALIAVGALAVDHGLIRNHDAFEVVLRQQQASATDNILLHGISGSQQQGGAEPAEALLDFLAYSGRQPLVAFHAFFDHGMLARAMRARLGLRYQALWLDLAWLLPALFPEHHERVVPLDDWQASLGIHNPRRHCAIADCLATAQLLQLALARAAERGIHSVAALAACEQRRRRLQW